MVEGCGYVRKKNRSPNFIEKIKKDIAKNIDTEVFNENCFSKAERKMKDIHNLISFVSCKNTEEKHAPYLKS